MYITQPPSPKSESETEKWSIHLCEPQTERFSQIPEPQRYSFNTPNGLKARKQIHLEINSI